MPVYCDPDYYPVARQDGEVREVEGHRLVSVFRGDRGVLHAIRAARARDEAAERAVARHERPDKLRVEHRRRSTTTAGYRSAIRSVDPGSAEQFDGDVKCSIRIERVETR